VRYEAPPDAHVRVYGRVVEGHGVASGRTDDPRFPDGTLALQWPHFAEVADLPLDGLHRATLNVRTTPHHVALVAPWWTLRGVAWHPEVPPEDFSFVPCRVTVGARRPVDGLVYHPHPETKPDHHQPADVLEVLLPRVSVVQPDAVVRLDLPTSQVEVTGPEPEG
jgi:hypothetical protein